MVVNANLPPQSSDLQVLVDFYDANNINYVILSRQLPNGTTVLYAIEVNGLSIVESASTFTPSGSQIGGDLNAPGFFLGDYIPHVGLSFSDPGCEANPTCLASAVGSGNNGGS